MHTRSITMEYKVYVDIGKNAKLILLTDSIDNLFEQLDKIIYSPYFVSCIEIENE